jgi:hypothetical protein
MESTADQCFVVDGPLKVIRVGGSDLWLAWVLARQRLKPRNRIARVTLPPLSYPVGIGSLVVGNALAGSGGGGPLRRDRDSFYRWCPRCGRDRLGDDPLSVSPHQLLSPSRPPLPCQRGTVARQLSTYIEALFRHCLL